MAARRLEEEKQTVEQMIRIYCRHHHHTAQLCPECAGLLRYAHTRLDRCRFGIDKPTCSKCPIHCYQPTRREAIKRVMRYAGPRMLWHSPIAAIRHLIREIQSGRNTVLFKSNAIKTKQTLKR